MGNFITTVDRQGNCDVLWMNVPGDREKVEDKRYTFPKTATGELFTCLQEFYVAMKEKVKEDSRALYDFVNYLCNEICGMNKPGGQWKKDLLHFTGKPLALVQISLTLETKQKRARLQTWKAGAEHTENQDESQWNIKFPSGWDREENRETDWQASLNRAKQLTTGFIHTTTTESRQIVLSCRIMKLP